MIYGCGDFVSGEQGAFRRVEFAKKLLLKQVTRECCELLIEVLAPNAWAIIGGDGDALEARFGVGPFVIEEALASVGRGEDPEERLGIGGEHGQQGVVEGVGDARGFVNEKKRGRGEAANGGFGVGESDDARAVR